MNDGKLQRAGLLIEQGKYDLAERELRRALVDDPGKRVCLHDVGDLPATSGQIG